MPFEQDLLLSKIIKVGDISKGGVKYHKVIASSSECDNLAKFLKIPALKALQANIGVSADRAIDGVRVKGELQAKISQTCGVTLEPFESDITVPFNIGFVHEIEEQGAELDLSFNSGDDFDLIIDNVIDLGAVVVEQLALHLDPFPRRPDAVFAYQDEDEELANPFAILKNKA